MGIIAIANTIMVCKNVVCMLCMAGIQWESTKDRFNMYFIGEVLSKNMRILTMNRAINCHWGQHSGLDLDIKIAGQI